MTKHNILRPALLILLPAGLLLLASYTLNWARFELNSDDYADRSVISDQLPEISPASACRWLTALPVREKTCSFSRNQGDGSCGCIRAQTVLC